MAHRRTVRLRVTPPRVLRILVRGFPMRPYIR
jgi:hypothetical protein